MKLGDVLEWLGIGAATAAGYVKGGVFVGLLVVAVGLLYEAQCHARTSLPWPTGVWARVKGAYRRQMVREDARRLGG